jgi:predicted enzyme related to lactoylglutathione lyase
VRLIRPDAKGVDCSVEAGRASNNGGRIQRDKFSIWRIWFIALILDTEGNMVGLHSME